MRDDMQTVRPKRGVRVVHVETQLGIVNIYLNLHDKQGRRVETVTLSGNNYAGEKRVAVRGGRLIELKTVMGGK